MMKLILFVFLGAMTLTLIGFYWLIYSLPVPAANHFVDVSKMVDR